MPRAMNPDDLFTADNVTVDALHETFDAAMMDVTLDDDGRLIVNDRYRVRVSLHGTDLIRFTCVFGLKEFTPADEAHALCDRIMNDLVIVRAYVPNPTTLVADWHLPARGGISRRAVVLAFRRFVDVVSGMWEHDTDDLVT